MNFAYVNEIVSQLLSNTFSVFCGAGASADITNSKWEDIFCETTRKFYHRKLSDDIYFLADLEKHYYNADHFYKDIVSVVSNGSGKESAHINGIINLNLNQVWTTNFDTHIEETIYRKYRVRPSTTLLWEKKVGLKSRPIPFSFAKSTHFLKCFGSILSLSANSPSSKIA